MADIPKVGTIIFFPYRARDPEIIDLIDGYASACDPGERERIFFRAVHLLEEAKRRESRLMQVRIEAARQVEALHRLYTDP